MNADNTLAMPGSRLYETTRLLLKSFYGVYRELGFGYLEAVYCNALAIAFQENGLLWQREVSVPVYFHRHVVGVYKADFVIANGIILEIKAARMLDAVHEAQLINYLRGSKIELGYLLNFGPRPRFKRLILSNSRKNPLRSSAAICGSSPSRNTSAPDDTPSSSNEPLTGA